VPPPNQRMAFQGHPFLFRRLAPHCYKHVGKNEVCGSSMPV
jgi:hypothetical protein